MTKPTTIRTNTLGGLLEEGLSLAAACHSVECKQPGQPSKPRRVELNLTRLVVEHGGDFPVKSLPLKCQSCGKSGSNVNIEIDWSNYQHTKSARGYS